MIVKYPNGRTVEGLLLSRQERSMRVALEDSADVAEFYQVQDTWVSEHLETVEIKFEWQRRPAPAPLPAEEDCVCSPELAEHLIGLLFSDSEEADKAPAAKYLTAGQAIM